MILGDTIYKRLNKIHNSKSFRYEFDIRYLSKWIKLYPDQFPNYVIDGNYELLFNSNKLRYEIYPIK